MAKEFKDWVVLMKRKKRDNVKSMEYLGLERIRALEREKEWKKKKDNKKRVEE